MIIVRGKRRFRTRWWLTPNCWEEEEGKEEKRVEIEDTFL